MQAMTNRSCVVSGKKKQICFTMSSNQEFSGEYKLNLKRKDEDIIITFLQVMTNPSKILKFSRQILHLNLSWEECFLQAKEKTVALLK